MQDTREEEEGQEKHGLSFHQTQNNSVQIIDSWLRNDIKKKDKKKRKKKTRYTILLENVNKWSEIESRINSTRCCHSFIPMQSKWDHHVFGKICMFLL